jgi:hypothetical protein
MCMHGSAEICIENIGREFEETEDAINVSVILFFVFYLTTFSIVQNIA